MSKSFVMDDEHWITINGNHVLINGEGEVQAGMGGALKGVKLSKATSSMKGGKFRDRSKERNKAQGALEKENAKAKERLRREFIRHDKENRKNQEEADKDYDKDNEKSFGYGRAYNRLRELDPKKYGPLMKRIKERGKSLELQREQRQQGFEEKRQNLYAEHENRKSKIIKEENEKRKPLLKSVLRKDKQLDTAKEALSSARGKIKSAREANAYMKQRGTKISKATPEMAGGRFVKPAEEAKSAENMAKTYERRYWSTGQRDENLTYAKSARRVANAYKKNEENARNALAKARPKIAERRQAVKKYNQATSGTITSSPKKTRPDLKRMEQDVMNKKSAYQTARKKMASPDELRKLRDELDQARFDYRKARFPKQYGN